MMLIDTLLILAILFFLFLPITDRRTVRMKLCVVGVLMTVFASTSAQTHVPNVRIAGIASSTR